MWSSFISYIEYSVCVIIAITGSESGIHRIIARTSVNIGTGICVCFVRSLGCSTMSQNIYRCASLLIIPNQHPGACTDACAGSSRGSRPIYTVNSAVRTVFIGVEVPCVGIVLLQVRVPSIGFLRIQQRPRGEREQREKAYHAENYRENFFQTFHC